MVVGVGVEVTARSSESAQVRERQDDGLSQNAAAFITTAPDVIAATPVTGNLPLTVLGASVTVSVYVGGRRR